MMDKFMGSIPNILSECMAELGVDDRLESRFF